MSELLGLRVMKWTAVLLVTVMAMLSAVPRVEAGFAPSGLVTSAELGRDADLAKVQAALENKLVSERLASLGYTRQEIDARLARLSEADLHGLAGQLDALAPGGELGVIIAVLLIVLLVFLIIRVAR
jgi:hypothetical protein